MSELFRILFYSVPAGILFSIIVFASYAASADFSIVSGFPGQTSEGFMALFGFASYTDLVINTLGFAVFCFLPLIPLLVFSARRFRANLQLKVWIAWIFISMLIVLVSPNTILAMFPYRWILLLTYPLAFYAAEAFTFLKVNLHKAAIGLMLVALSVGFVALPNSMPFPYYAAYPTYVPTSMLQNTISLSDCQDAADALQWVQNNLSVNGRLLVHDSFYGLASLNLNADQLITYGNDDPETVAQNLTENDLQNQLYLIWWVNGSGWYAQPTVSSVFKEVYSSGKIAVYTYQAHASASEYLISDNW